MLVGAILLISITGLLDTQTCSCAATPLFTALDTSVSLNKTWRIELAFKYHAINDLVQGTEKVADDTPRRRRQQSILLDIRYALSSRLTLRGVFSGVRQFRDVGISLAPSVSTQGLGDSMISLQYNPVVFTARNPWAL
jgi:hypothetical protein